MSKSTSLADFHVRLGNLSDVERAEYNRRTVEKAALTRKANRFESIQKRRAKAAGFNNIDDWQGWLRNIMTSGLVRLPKDHPLRAVGLVIDPLKYARVLLRSGLYKDEEKRTRRFIEKFEDPLKAEGFGYFKHSPNMNKGVDLLDPEYITKPKNKGGRPRKVPTEEV
ncbi:MAG: hypothetical protein HC888_00830 [Candidatus Competibacteraceae bacterium]|nr:hypothetical protein [Candidatus Competibacteraceae bacterium]